MNNAFSIIETQTVNLRKELNNPKLSEVKKTYLVEKIKILEEILHSKEK